MRRVSSVVVLGLAAIVWVGALVLAPTAAAQSRPILTAASAVVYAGGSLICHQKPERSFHREGAQLPVCARCFGLYAGGVLGVLAWILVAGLTGRPSARAWRWTSSTVIRRILWLAGFPTLISVVSAWLGWWDAGNTLRATLALPLGAAVGAVATAVAAGDLR